MPLTVAGTPIEDLRIVVPAPVDVPGAWRWREGRRKAPSSAAFREQHPGEMSSELSASGGARRPLHVAAPAGGVAIQHLDAARLDDQAAHVPRNGSRRGRAGGGHKRRRAPRGAADVAVTAVTVTVSDTSCAPVVDYHAIVFPADGRVRHSDGATAHAWRRRTRRAGSGSGPAARRLPGCRGGRCRAQ